ncbi:FG-GAP-like repeat-containing protein [Streptomyces sp. 7R016]|uniref:FG-GAP-like repeat-containing protein n=1 Tax=Streptomyces spinosisporus TaxID=2927582 RepID=A0ABS9XCC8_9ACTN|nr:MULTISPECIES: FG-GAP-like repeat-containing protein [Streptomyces]MCI3239705.1 FG-GAP-like repeat-containing protein [Streptomyces spinosisporus]WUB41609.1 FG-GAP-like repeat-containing protein [Streptomyces sp. NBC_00588]
MKRRAWLTLGAVVVGGGGVVTYALASPSQDAGAAGRAKRPVKVYDLALKSSSGSERELPRTSTKQFSLLGVSWTGATKKVHGTAQVRTRSLESGQWSAWQPLELDEDPVEDVEPGMRGASEPLWVGPSNGVEVQVVHKNGSTSTGLPKGFEVNLVDPGVVTKAETRSIGTEVDPAAFVAETSPAATNSASPTDAPSPSPGDSTTATPGTSEPATASPTVTTSPSPSATASDTASASPSPSETKPTAPPSTVTEPPIISRAQWGADESTVDDPPSYIDKVQAVFVHHTVGSNSYSCAQSASLVRGIMAYHIQSNGWNDIGYNFLVDKCGQIFEGRAGGVDLPVMGAHTYGFNSYSTGIAILGDYQGDPAKGIPAGRPTRATLESVARLAAWKLGQYGGNPTGTVTLTAMGDTGVWKNGQQATLNTISGHRDAYATECPGDAMYAKLGEIRRFAASAAANSAIPTADFNRDGINDLVAGVPQASGGVGNVAVVPGGTDGPVGSARIRLTQSSEGVPGSSETGDNFGAATAWGDVNGDGYADLAIGAPGEDDTSGHKDRGSVTVLNGPGLNSGTSYTTSGVTSSGAKLGAAVTVGDFNADGKADVFSAGSGNGGSWNVHLTGGATQYGKLTGSTGSVAYLDAATGDFNRDGYADVALNYRDQSTIGRVTWFKGSKSGLTKVSVLSVKGGRSIAAGDVNGNGYDDIVIGQPYTAESGAHAGGQVTMVPGTSTGFTTTGMRTIHQDSSGVPGSAEDGDAMGSSVSVGDYNADGYADVLAGVPNEDIVRSGANQSNAGMVVLLKGTSSGLTGSGAHSYSQDTSGITGSTEPNDKIGSAVVLSDLSGWGRADLAIGGEGENSYDGTILQLDSGSSGVATGTGVYYGRDTLGTPAGAHLGQTLTP